MKFISQGISRSVPCLLELILTLLFFLSHLILMKTSINSIFQTWWLPGHHKKSQKNNNEFIAVAILLLIGISAVFFQLLFMLNIKNYTWINWIFEFLIPKAPPQKFYLNIKLCCTLFSLTKISDNRDFRLKFHSFMQ